MDEAVASLAFELEVGPEEWMIQGLMPGVAPRRIPSPLIDDRFCSLVANLRDWASRSVPLDRPDLLETEAFVQGLACHVSAQLTEILFMEEDQRAVAAALKANRRVRLEIRVRPAPDTDTGLNLAADLALALPWELLAPEKTGSWPVRDGHLSIVREAITDLAPDLPEPSGPLTLAVTIAAPEDRVGIPYEQESFHLLAALSPLGQRMAFSDLGSLEDLTSLVEESRATAIHFRGHGLPGGLLFENALGFSEEVPVGELHRRLATVLLNPRRAGSFPGLFFLAAPFTAREVSSSQGSAASPFDEEASSAAALHRGGFAQVIGYFGPTSPELTSRLEQRFYGALAQGSSTLKAAEMARATLNEPVETGGKRDWHPFGWTQLAVYHRGPDRPLALPGRGRRLPARFRRRAVQVNGLPVLERGFVGRRDLQHEIRRRVHGGQRLLVLQGLGGLGKTALASHLMTRIFATKPADRLILRCHEAESAADPVLVLRSQAENHGRVYRFRLWDERMRDLRERFPAPVEGFIQVVRALRLDRPHLAIYADNAESLQEGPKTDDLRPLGTWRPGIEAWWRALKELEKEGEGLILLTTRYLWRDLEERAWVGIGPMSAAESLRMIDSFSALAKLPREARVRIARLVDGHPRTMEYLDRLVAQHRRKLGRRRVADHWRELIAPVLPAQMEQITADLLLETIWQRLPDEAREHAKCISVLQKTAPWFVIDRLGKAGDELIRSGLLLRSRESVFYEEGTQWILRWGMHALTRQFVTERMTAGETLQAQRAAGAAYEEWVGTPAAQWEDEEEAIHYLHLLGEGDRAWPITEVFVLTLREQGRFHEALEILETSRESGVSGDQAARCLALIVQMRYFLGEQDDPFQSRLQEARKLASNPATRSLIEELTGDLFHAQGRYVEAETAYRRALEIEENGASLHNLALVLMDQARYEEAEELLQRSLEIARQAGDEDQSAATLHALASLRSLQFRNEEAEDLFAQSLSAFDSELDPDHPDLALALVALADHHKDRGDLLETEDILRRAISDLGKALGENHPSYWTAQVKLAQVLLKKGRTTEAERLLGKCRDVLEKIRGTLHRSHITALEDLAETLELQGRYREAEDLVRSRLEAARHSEVDPFSYRYVVLRLASILEHQDRYTEAEDLIRTSLPVFRKQFGENHPNVFLTMTLLGRVLKGQERYKEAEELLRNSLAAAEALWGSRHPQLRVILNDLADILIEQEENGEAEILLCRALDLCSETQEDNLSDRALILSGLAHVRYLLGRPEAQAAAAEAIELLATSLGPEHPITLELIPILQGICQNHE